MRDPEQVARAQHAAARLETAWERWRALQGMADTPAQPVVGYVGYALKEPWGQPRAVIGFSADEAERLAEFLEHDNLDPRQRAQLSQLSQSLAAAHQPMSQRSATGPQPTFTPQPSFAAQQAAPVAMVPPQQVPPAAAAVAPPAAQRQSAERQPVERQQPVERRPVERQPAERQPVEVQSAERQPVERQAPAAAEPSLAASPLSAASPPSPPPSSPPSPGVAAVPTAPAVSAVAAAPVPPGMPAPQPRVSQEDTATVGEPPAEPPIEPAEQPAAQPQVAVTDGATVPAQAAGADDQPAAPAQAARGRRKQPFPQIRSRSSS